MHLQRVTCNTHAICPQKMSFSSTTSSSVFQSAHYSDLLYIRCWVYCSAPRCVFSPLGWGKKSIQKNNNVQSFICSADIQLALVGLAGSLIKQVFFFFVLVFSLNSQPLFLNKRSVRLLLFLLSTCQSFVSCTFLKVHIGTRALGLFEDCACGLDCSDISCWFNVTLHLKTLSSGRILFLFFFFSPSFLSFKLEVSLKCICYW